MSKEDDLDSEARSIPKILKTMVTTVRSIPNRTIGQMCFGVLAARTPPIATRNAMMLNEMST